LTSSQPFLSLTGARGGLREQKRGIGVEKAKWHKNEEFSGGNPNPKIYTFLLSK